MERTKKKSEMPTLTVKQYLDAVLSGIYNEDKIKEIKIWQKNKNLKGAT